jgi:protein involved in polysaccharide export with SLBB domain/beta-lactamase regulating signal transducer with metallopeptidase domain
MNPIVTEVVRSLLDAPAAGRLGWTLVHFLWQGAAAAALLTVLLAALRRRKPVHRYAVACAVMGLMAAAPLITFVLLAAVDAGGAVRTGTGAAAGVAPAGVARVVQPGPDHGVPVVALPAASVAVEGYVVLPWLLGVMALSAWRVGGWLLLGRMVRTTARPAGAAVQRAAEVLCRRLGVRRAVRLVESAWVQVPSVIGALRPVVLLPASALSGLSPQQLEAILAHELAHVRRHDYLVNLLQAAAETLLFYHPAVWWVSCRVREERELCCDDVAAEACGDRVLYARALADLESRRDVPGGVAMSARGGSLVRRIRRLLGVEEPRRAAPAAGILAICCVASLLAAARLGAAPDAPPSDKAATADASDAAVGDGPPLEEDLVPDTGDYRIGGGDLLSVTISNLQGPGVETVKQTRVPNSGTISLPYVGTLTAAGRTEIELEKDIAAIYRAKNLIEQAQISVSVMEATQNRFSLMGDVARPGVYAAVPGNFRVTDAIAMGGTRGGVEQVRVVRRPKVQGAAGRAIVIPMAKLTAGETKYNVVVRPGDVVLVKGGDSPVVKLVVRAEGPVIFEGSKATWDEVPALLEKIDADRRADTVLLVIPASDEMTVRQFRAAQERAEALVTKLGLKGLKVDYAGKFEAAPAAPGGADAPAPPERKKELPQDAGSVQGAYYMGGKVARPGAYTFGGRPVNIRQALIAAQLPEGPAKDYEVTVIRKTAGRPEELFVTGLDAVLEAGNRTGTAPLRDGDQVMLGDLKPKGAVGN